MGKFAVGQRVHFTPPTREMETKYEYNLTFPPILLNALSAQGTVILKQEKAGRSKGEWYQINIVHPSSGRLLFVHESCLSEEERWV